jgi:hypothetical protein
MNSCRGEAVNSSTLRSVVTVMKSHLLHGPGHTLGPGR